MVGPFMGIRVQSITTVCRVQARQTKQQQANNDRRKGSKCQCLALESQSSIKEPNLSNLSYGMHMGMQCGVFD